MTTSKISRTNKNIIAELNAKGIQVLTNTAWAYFLKGEYNGQKIEIGCSRLQDLIYKRSLLTQYLGFEPKY
jgi:hypothetical protein